ncbi:hypothetical protein [Rheinheimera sp.]|uniref:hypothetical protein n=1 Tax=Rheinheimera sp. TaxID=1869214 RepID=UPI00307E37E8
MNFLKYFFTFSLFILPFFSSSQVIILPEDPLPESGFFPSKVKDGVPVQFRHYPGSVMNNCTVSGLPGYSSDRRIGDIVFNFNASSSLNVKVSCISGMGPLPPDGGAKVETEHRFIVEPVITIDFPSGIFTTGEYWLRITHKNTQSCALYISDNKYAIVASVPSSYSGKYSWTNGAGTEQAFHLKCIGDDGVNITQSHRFTVTASPIDYQAPNIRSFIHGDIVMGRTHLFWMAENVSTCKLSGMGKSANVGIVEYVGYPVDVPVGDTQFTLACSKESKTVTKNVIVYRMQFPGGSEPSPCIDCNVEPLSTNDDVKSFVAKNVGFDTEQFVSSVKDKKQITHFDVANENYIGFLVVDRVENVTKAYIANKQDKSIEQISTIFGVLDIRDIDSITYNGNENSLTIIVSL